MHVNAISTIIQALVSAKKSAHVDTLISVCQDFYNNVKDINFEELDDE